MWTIEPIICIADSIKDHLTNRDIPRVSNNFVQKKRNIFVRLEWHNGTYVKYYVNHERGKLRT